MIIAHEDTSRELAALLQEEREWQAKLFANVRLSPAQKLVAWEAWVYLRSYRAPGDDGMVRIYLGTIAAHTGLSDDRVSAALKTLAEIGAFGKENRATWIEEKGKDGKVRRLKQSHIYLGFTLLTDHPGMWGENAPARNHGGKRVKKCEACGSEDLIEQRTVYCRTCGTQQGPSEFVGVNGQPIWPEENASPASESTELEVTQGAKVSNPIALVDDVALASAGEEPNVQEAETVKRPVVFPMAARPALPDVPCYFCNGKQPWRWRPDPNDGWTCTGCYSSLAMTLHNRVLERGLA
jgi:hypothetical protein